MQSKFWAREASSDSASNASQSDEEAQTRELPTKTTTEKSSPVVKGRWAAESTSSSDDDRRVVKSVHDKRWEELRDTVKHMKNHIKIDDYAEISKDYENLFKSLVKFRQIVETEGNPKFFIRTLVELEDYLEEKHKDRENFKKLSKARATAFNTLRAKVRKGNEGYKNAIDECRMNRKNFDSSDESDSADDSDFSDNEDIVTSESSDSYSSEAESDDTETDKKKKAKATSTPGSGEESDWGSGESNSGDEGSDEGSAVDKHERAVARWGVKSASKVRTTKSSTSKKKTSSTLTRKKTAKQETDNVSQSIKAVPLSSADITMLLDANNLSLDIIRSRVKLLSERRGRKGVDRSQQCAILKKLASLARSLEGSQPFLEVASHLVASYFDIHLGAFTPQSITVWNDAYQLLLECLNILCSDKNAFMVPVVIQIFDEEGDEVEATEKATEQIETKNELSAQTFCLLAERLDDELYKGLQFTDVHTMEYKERLSHTFDILALLWRLYQFLISNSMHKMASGVALRMSEQLYFRYDTIALKVWSRVKTKLPQNVDHGIPTLNGIDDIEENTKVDESLLPSGLIRSFANFVFRYGESKQRSLRAMLHLVYNRALHDDYSEAKDLLLKTNAQELAIGSDVSIQILYNRCMVQIGLCAFRHGYIREAHSELSEICGLNKQKELLAQGLSAMRNQERSADQERAEMRRLIPYHMHISLELLECAHILSAMILEIPAIAIASTGVSDASHKSKRPISRVFRRLLDAYERQPFIGPPENSREVIMAAAKALQKGDWVLCSKHVFSLSMWDILNGSEKAKLVVLDRIKKEALKTYVISYSAFYASFGLDQLSEMFSLSKVDTRSVISKMMVREEFLGSWDESTEHVIVSNVAYNKIESLCNNLADVVCNAVNQNEFTLNMKNPKFAAAFDRKFGKEPEKIWSTTNTGFGRVGLNRGRGWGGFLYNDRSYHGGGLYMGLGVAGSYLSGETKYNAYPTQTRGSGRGGAGRSDYLVRSTGQRGMSGHSYRGRFVGHILSGIGKLEDESHRGFGANERYMANTFFSRDPHDLDLQLGGQWAAGFRPQSPTGTWEHRAESEWVPSRFS